MIGKIEGAHSGFIKGLSWDPAGKFLASQSDDGSCVVWNIESMLSSQGSSSAFTLDSNDSEMFKETVLEKIFVNMSKMTFFHRPSWSPDGTILALANATNRQLPAVALVERNNWQGPGTFLLGHLGPVEVVKFNPRLFSNTHVIDRKEMICAVASQDGQVSIWSSSRTAPLLVLQELFEHSVMDLSWTPDGKILVAVSYDGAAVAIRVNPTDFDLAILSDSDHVEHLKNVFGNISSSSGDSVQGYIENAKVVECLRENEQFLSNHPPKETEAKESEMKEPETNESFTLPFKTTNIAPIPQDHLSSAPTATVQTEQVVNGKKRITPQLLMTSGATNAFGNNTSFSSQSQPQGLRSMGTVRLRDEDFLIHRKLLERTTGLLLNNSKNTKDSTVSVFEFNESSSVTNISVPLTNTSIFSVSIEIINNIDSNGRKSSALIQFIQNSQIIWKERIRGTIYQACGTKKYSAYAIKTADSSSTFKHFILVLTGSGRRYLPLISLDSHSVHLKLNTKTNLLSSVTQNGTISIWDLKNCKQVFCDSSICNYIPNSPVKLLDFDESKYEITLLGSSTMIYNEPLGIWTNTHNKSNNTSQTETTTLSPAERSEAIEKLKVKLLSAQQFDDRQISELEFELSLIFVNLRNGKPLNPNEEIYFQRILATYALKLAKENRALKAKELVEDLKELKCEDLVEDLLKPLFTFNLNNSKSSVWQDLISQLL